MRKGIVTIVIILLCSGLWYAAFSWSKHLEVSKITIRGNVHVDTDELLNIVAISDTVLFENIDLSEIQRRVKNHPYIKNASVNRDFPATIRISVTERKPDALLVGSRMALVDDENVVMPVRHSEVLQNLAAISGSFTIPQSGDTLRHTGVGEALQIIRATNRSDVIMNQLFSEIWIMENGGLLAYTADRGVPVLLGNNVTAKQLIAFKEFWLDEVVPAGADRVESIDLRFDDQVIARWR